MDARPIIPLILAGGGGTRLWPLSRSHYPKQFLSVEADFTLLQSTLRRVMTGLEHIGPAVVVCNEEHRFLVGEQARRAEAALSRIILEPSGRNTAPALTAAALTCAEAGDDPLLLMMPADHLVPKVDAFLAAVRRGLPQAEAGAVVVFGVVPTAAETGYGYIELAQPLDQETPMVSRLRGFREKPSREVAEAYVSSGNYRWNAGIFLLRTSVWLELMHRYQPAMLAACRQAVEQGSRDGEFFRLQAEAFRACPSDSIDYAVMERLASEDPSRAAVVSLDAGWSDVGSWSSLWEVLPHDAHGVARRGDVCALDCKDSLLFSESRLVAAVGCEDLVVVETADAVMVAPRARAQEVKALVEWLEQQDRTERLTHRRVSRPWGAYEGVDAGERFQVKRIVVNPGASLSLQMHHHRAEHWIVVKGTARVTRGNDVFLLSENQSTYIPLGEKHRLENPGTIPLEIVEVQSGAYLGEDDIVRFEDRYQRL